MKLEPAMIILIPTSTPITQVADDGSCEAIRMPAMIAATPLARTQPQPECGLRRKAMMIYRRIMQKPCT